VDGYVLSSDGGAYYGHRLRLDDLDVSGQNLYLSPTKDLRARHHYFTDNADPQDTYEHSLYVSNDALWYRWYDGSDWHYQKVAGP